MVTSIAHYNIEVFIREQNKKTLYTYVLRAHLIEKKFVVDIFIYTQRQVKISISARV